MSKYRDRVSSVLHEYREKERRKDELKKEVEEYNVLYKNYVNRIEALKYITLIAEDNTRVIREYLESVINRALDVVFGKRYKFELQSNIEKQQVELVLMEYLQGEWWSLDIKLQAGKGMGQMIAFLYSLVLTEITGHRMLFLVDEVMGGLAPDAVKFVKRVLKEFAKNGAQFVIIEYTINEFAKQLNISVDGEQSIISSEEVFSVV